MSEQARPALRAVLIATFLCAMLATSGCAGGRQRFENREGDARIGGFSYRLPGLGWRAVHYPETKAGTLYHHYQRDGDRLQFQLTAFEPVRPVRNEADIVAWARQAGGPDVAVESGRGALCARYSHRWSQTLSLGGPPMPWATIEERGLFCIDPLAPHRLLQVRVFERLEPGAAKSPEFEDMAQRVISGVRAAPS